MSQWVNVPEGASGSSRIRTKLFDPDGIFTQETPGVRDDPVQVNSCGSVAPGMTESTARVKVSDGAGINVGMDAFIDEAFMPEGRVSGAVQPQKRTNTTIRHSEKIHRIFMNLISPAGQIYLTKPKGGAGSLTEMTAPKATRCTTRVQGAGPVGL
jgi:hypothetical protein